MFVRITEVHVWPGDWSTYEAIAERLTLEGRAWAEGRRQTWMIRSLDDENSGVSIQIWDSWEALEAYETSEFYATRVQPLVERLVAGEYPVRRGVMRFNYEDGAGWAFRRSGPEGAESDV